MRMGVATGEAELRGRTTSVRTINRAARVMVREGAEREDTVAVMERQQQRSSPDCEVSVAKVRPSKASS